MVWLAWLACTRAPPAPVHHLAFGGDLCAGKELNLFLHDPEAARRIFSDAPSILREADLTLVNLEGVISGGGWLADKGEPRPILYRARPELAGVLRDAGVDVVTVANNHSGDYGPDALHETLDTLAGMGIDAVGGGLNRAGARQPVYRQVGDVVVAFVAADLTGTRAFGATDTQPGTWVVDPADAVAQLGAAVPEARRHADIVLLTVHWGENFAREPTPATRRLAKGLIDAGYDAILGHSAHVFQGVELIDGRPVIYDAGNLLAGHQGLGDQAVGMVYDLGFTRAGVVSVRPVPVSLAAGQVLSGPSDALDTWTTRSEALGTVVVDRALALRPPPRPAPTAPPPPRPALGEPFRATSDAWVDALPPFATPLEATFANGMTLIGYRMVAPALRLPKAAQVVDLYFRVDAPQPADLQIEVRAEGDGRDRDRHLPADGALAGPELEVGRILHDRSLLRLRHAGNGTLTFSVALTVGGRAVDVVAPEVMDGGVVLGTRSFDPLAVSVFDYPGMEPPR